MNHLINIILKEARWIGKVSQEDWLEKIVEHTTPTGERSKVKVKSLPPEEQEKYRPKQETNIQDKKEELKLHVKKDKLKNELKEKTEEVSKTPSIPSVSDSHRNHQLKTKELSDLSRKLFSTENPTVDHTTKLKEKDVESFKNYNRIKREHTKSFKNLRESVFNESNVDSMNVDEYKKKMQDLGSKTDIDSEFKGKIEKNGNLLTNSGKLLLSKMGSNVKMNPNYDSSTDNTFYCKSTNPTGNSVTHYTEDFFYKRKKEKYAKNVKFGEQIDGMRSKISDDIKSDDQRKKIIATMVSLVDQGFFRIGNSKSEKSGVRGLHNLQIKHLNFDDKNRMHFKYTGKDKVHQHKIIGDDKITNIMKDLTKDKDKKDYLFSFKQGNKTTRIRPEHINDYMHNELKSPVTVHKFRTYHATRMAKENLDQVKLPKKATKTKLMEEFKKAINKVSKNLGHTNTGTTIKHYIDTSVLQDFFDKHNVEPPKIISDMKHVAFKEVILKSSQNDFINVTSDHSITDKEKEFNNWMDTLPERVKQANAIEIKDKPNDEEQYFI